MEWNDLQIQFCEARDIAKALINKEVTLNTLKSISTFAPRAAVVEDAVWSICNQSKLYQQYLDIYPNGKYSDEARRLLDEIARAEEEKMWKAAVAENTIEAYMNYQQNYPNGIHVAEIEDKVWNVVLFNKNFKDYVSIFPNGKYASDANDYIANQKKEDDDWELAISIDTPESYQRYLADYPNGRYVQKAEARKTELNIGQKEMMIHNLMEDCNAYSLQYLKMCGITAEDLKGKMRDSKKQVRDDVLRSWNRIEKNLELGKTPDSLSKGSTEVYFWGVMGSGKTCAMAAILSTATKMGYYEPYEGPGLKYMSDLANTFNTEPGVKAVRLPKGTSTDSTQYLPLILNEDVNGRIKEHKLSIVEISGEIFTCFSRELQGGKDSIPEKLRPTYNSLLRYLKSDTNPKYHFFVLDSNPDQDQMADLQQAAVYFKNNNIFNSTTQGISLIVTKSDTLSPDRNQWANLAVDCVNEHFGAFVRTLKKIVGPSDKGGLGLSDGSLTVIPLSIGEIFFRQLCVFDPEPSKKLVKLLIEYSKVAETDDWKKKGKRFFRK